MATRKEAPASESKAGRKTEKLNVWLYPNQIAWLKEKGGPTDTVRALITEAMALDNLARSVKKKKR